MLQTGRELGIRSDIDRVGAVIEGGDLAGNRHGHQQAHDGIGLGACRVLLGYGVYNALARPGGGAAGVGVEGAVGLQIQVAQGLQHAAALNADRVGVADGGDGFAGGHPQNQGVDFTFGIGQQQIGHAGLAESAPDLHIHPLQRGAIQADAVVGRVGGRGIAVAHPCHPRHGRAGGADGAVTLGGDLHRAARVDQLGPTGHGDAGLGVVGNGGIAGDHRHAAGGIQQAVVGGNDGVEGLQLQAAGLRQRPIGLQQGVLADADEGARLGIVAADRGGGADADAGELAHGDAVGVEILGEVGIVVLAAVLVFTEVISGLQAEVGGHQLRAFPHGDVAAAGDRVVEAHATAGGTKADCHSDALTAAVDRLGERAGQADRAGGGAGAHRAVAAQLGHGRLAGGGAALGPGPRQRYEGRPQGGTDAVGGEGIGGTGAQGHVRPVDTAVVSQAQPHLRIGAGIAQAGGGHHHAKARREISSRRTRAAVAGGGEVVHGIGGQGHIAAGLERAGIQQGLAGAAAAPPRHVDRPGDGEAGAAAAGHGDGLVLGEAVGVEAEDAEVAIGREAGGTGTAGAGAELGGDAVGKAALQIAHPDGEGAFGAHRHRDGHDFSADRIADGLLIGLHHAEARRAAAGGRQGETAAHDRQIAAAASSGHQGEVAADRGAGGVGDGGVDAGPATAEGQLPAQGHGHRHRLGLIHLGLGIDGAEAEVASGLNRQGAGAAGTTATATASGAATATAIVDAERVGVGDLVVVLGRPDAQRGDTLWVEVQRQAAAIGLGVADAGIGAGIDQQVAGGADAAAAEAGANVEGDDRIVEGAAEGAGEVAAGHRHAHRHRQHVVIAAGGGSDGDVGVAAGGRQAAARDAGAHLGQVGRGGIGTAGAAEQVGGRHGPHLSGAARWSQAHGGAATAHLGAGPLVGTAGDADGAAAAQLHVADAGAHIPQQTVGDARTAPRHGYSETATAAAAGGHRHGHRCGLQAGLIALETAGVEGERVHAGAGGQVAEAGADVVVEGVVGQGGADGDAEAAATPAGKTGHQCGPHAEGLGRGRIAGGHGQVARLNNGRCRAVAAGQVGGDLYRREVFGVAAGAGG